MLSEQQQPCSQDGTLTVRNGPTVTAPCRIFPKCSSTYPSFVESWLFSLAAGRFFAHKPMTKLNARDSTWFRSAPIAVQPWAKHYQLLLCDLRKSVIFNQRELWPARCRVRCGAGSKVDRDEWWRARVPVDLSHVTTYLNLCKLE